MKTTMTGWKRIAGLATIATATATTGFLIATSVAEAHYPQISPIPDVYLVVNEQGPMMRFTISDRETRADDLQVSASSNNPQVVPNDDDHIELGGTGQDRWIIVTPADDQQGFASIMVTLTDGDGDTDREPFRVIVRPPANQ